MVDRSVAGATR